MRKYKILITDSNWNNPIEYEFTALEFLQRLYVTPSALFTIGILMEQLSTTDNTVNICYYDKKVDKRYTITSM